MHLRKAPDESLEDFHDHFIHFCYEFSEDDIDWNFMKERFQFLVHIFMNPTEYESFESVPTYIGISIIVLALMSTGSCSWCCFSCVCVMDDWLDGIFSWH